jgi:hypothetical protein
VAGKETGNRNGILIAPYNPSAAEETLIATFSDPGGNYFQLVSPMEMR